MTTTTPSTETTDRLVTELLPPEHAALVLKACNALSKQQDHADRMRKARTARLHAMVHNAIHAKKARLAKEPRHNWTSILMQHYFDKREIAIDEETVRAAVHTFPGFL